MNDDRLEAEIRSFLGARDPMSVPSTLRARISDVPLTAGRSTAVGRAIGRLAPLVIGLAMLVAIAGVALVAHDRSSSGNPGQTQGPLPSLSVPAVRSGDGYVTTAPPIIQAFLLLAILGTLLRVATGVGHGRRVIALGVGATMVGATLFIASIDAIDPDASMASMVAPIDDASTGAGVYPLAAGETVPIAIWVTNRFRWPITILGIPTPAAVGGTTLTRPAIVAIGRLAQPESFDPGHAIPFRPVVLAPGETIDLFFLIGGGECGLATDGPKRATIADATFVYEVLSIQKLARVHLGSPIQIPIRTDCGD